MEELLAAGGGAGGCRWRSWWLQVEELVAADGGAGGCRCRTWWLQMEELVAVGAGPGGCSYSELTAVVRRVVKKFISNATTMVETIQYITLQS